MTSLGHLECSAIGPEVRDDEHVNCNRALDHDGPHRRYDPETYEIIAEWRDEPL